MERSRFGGASGRPPAFRFHFGQRATIPIGKTTRDENRVDSHCCENDSHGSRMSFPQFLGGNRFFKDTIFSEGFRNLPNVEGVGQGGFVLAAWVSERVFTRNPMLRWLRGCPRNQIINRLKPADYPFRIQIRNDRCDIISCHNIFEQYLNIRYDHHFDQKAKNNKHFGCGCQGFVLSWRIRADGVLLAKSWTCDQTDANAEPSGRKENRRNSGVLCPGVSAAYSAGGASPVSRRYPRPGTVTM
jgi:hypothetical protein